MRIGIYGGTFNPPHLGHFTAAQFVMQRLKLDKLLLIPAAIPPHKALPEKTPEPATRLAMTELMADALQMPEQVSVSDLELNRAGKSYTADTLRIIQAQYPHDELWLLVGSDMFLTLHQWWEPDVILSLASICAFTREVADDMPAILAQKERLEQDFHARILLLPLPDPVEISSTQLRENVSGYKMDLLPAVYGYILMHDLYGTHADLKHLNLTDLRACSDSMIQQKRVPHIRGTEETAVRLAERWGADTTLAQRAAILHDCTKYWDLTQHKQLCQTYGVELDELEQQTVKLLHAKTGACIAKYIFGEPDAVYDAIFWHTTGAAHMSLLAKILYMADYIEPTRVFEGVNALREMAYLDLDRAILMGVESTIEDMRQRGYQIHKNTMDARQWFFDQCLAKEKHQRPIP